MNGKQDSEDQVNKIPRTDSESDISGMYQSGSKKWQEKEEHRCMATNFSYGSSEDPESLEDIDRK